jgi:phosphoglycerate dehydrogenase-like enzyme
MQYTLPGCGDTDAKLPEAFYSTSDSASLRQFLSETDVLVCSLPSTKHTMHLLDAEKLSELCGSSAPDAGVV